MAVELRHPKGRVFFDGNAAAAALGELSWFHAGTTTPQTVYADKDESVPLPNPLTLDSAGRAVDSGGDLVAVYFSDSSGNDAKEVLKDSNGATVYTDDEIPKPVDPTEGLSDFSKPLTQWSTDTASSVDIATSGLGRGRLADTSSNSITYNLPSASAAGNGKGIAIKKTAAANSVTLDGDGSETIDGTGTYSFDAPVEIWVFSDGANWRILVRPTVPRKVLDHLRFSEQSPEPSAPSANDIVLYPRDDGSGNTQFVLKDSDGNERIIPMPLLHVQDQKSSGTNSASLTDDTWNTRELNTALTNEISGAALGSNQITLPAGTYYIEASATAVISNGQHHLRLRNTSDSSTELVGSSEIGRTNTDTDNASRSFLAGRFTLAASKTLEIQHYINDAWTGHAGVNSGEVEVYADARIWKVG